MTNHRFKDLSELLLEARKDLGYCPASHSMSEKGDLWKCLNNIIGAIEILKSETLENSNKTATLAKDLKLIVKRDRL